MNQRHNDTGVSLLKTIYNHLIEGSPWDMFLIPNMNNYQNKNVFIFMLIISLKKNRTFITLKEHFKYLDEINSNIWKKLTQIDCTEVTFKSMITLQD